MHQIEPDPPAQNRLMMGPDGTVTSFRAAPRRIHRQQNWKVGPAVDNGQTHPVTSIGRRIATPVCLASGGRWTAGSAPVTRRDAADCQRS